MKNTRRYCDPCSTPSSRPLTLSDNLTVRRNQRKAGIDVLGSIPRGSTTWWGRVGELLFFHLYPDAQDVNALYGNRAPYDALHLQLGKVSVKTACRGVRGSWKFQLTPADHTLMLGFSRSGDCLEMGWLVPSDKLPAKLKVQNPGSKEYQSTYELDQATVGILNRQFGVLQQFVTSPRKLDMTRYERTSLGRLGEAVYAALYPQSDHVAARDSNSPYDFLDPSGVRVNVRTRRPSPDGRWTWTTAGSPPDEYWLVGLDPLGKVAQVAFRVPIGVMPAKGFSYRLGSDTRWDAYRDLKISAKVSDLLGHDADFQIVLGGLTRAGLDKMSPLEMDTLVDQIVAHYQKQGFPYPSLLSDQQVEREIRLVQQYTRSEEYPPCSAGVGFLNPYMPHRYETRNHAATFSAVQAFGHAGRLRKTVLAMTRWGKVDFSPRGLLSSLTALNRTPGHFPPAVACALVREFSPERSTVLDPCAGWGGRLLGCLAAGRRYLGVESWSVTANALCQVSARLASYGGATILNQSFLDLSGVSAPMILTCPPYWDVETYEEATPKSLLDWVQDFVLPFARKCYECLDAGGTLVLVMQDVTVRDKVIPLVQIWSDALSGVSLRLVETRQMKRTRFGKAKRDHDKVLIWRK